jgi:hypothetical protein
VTGSPPGRPARGFIAGLVLLAVLVAGCAAADDGGGGGGDHGGPVVVTFEVAGGETFKVRLTDPADIAIAHQLLANEEAPSIPNGLVVRDDPDVNEGYSWSIDPDDFEFADATIEVCDGLPSDVEAGIITSDRYCPWSAIVVSIEPAS